ncbi:MAG: hypothetical protein ACOCQI_05465 [Desulfosalsimonas sp.]
MDGSKRYVKDNLAEAIIEKIGISPARVGGIKIEMSPTEKTRVYVECRLYDEEEKDLGKLIKTYEFQEVK